MFRENAASKHGREKRAEKKELNLAKAFRSDNLLSFYQSIPELRHKHYIYRFNVYMQKKRNNTESRGASMFPKSLTFSRKNSCIFYVL